MLGCANTTPDCTAVVLLATIPSYWMMTKLFTSDPAIKFTNRPALTKI